MFISSLSLFCIDVNIRFWFEEDHNKKEDPFYVANAM